MSAAKKTFTLEEIHDILRDQPPQEFFEDSRISEATIAVLGSFAARQFLVFVKIAAIEEAGRADN
jgi:hypothetical protein